MTPEELNAHHRSFVITQLARHSAVVKKLMMADDPVELSRFILENGSVLAEHGLAPATEAPRLNKVFMALYKNTQLEEWNWQFLEAMQKDLRASEIIRQMNFAPETVPVKEFQYVYDTYLAADNFVRPALEIILGDPEFRSAMDLEDGITVDEFRRRSLDFAANSETYDDFQKMARQYGYFGPFQCGWTVCTVPFVFVFANIVVGVSPVTCVSGNTVLSSVARMIPPQGNRLQSLCENNSAKTVWLIVKGHSGFRRVPLRSGETSRDLDLMRVEALLIGGRGNELASVVLPAADRQASGCYVLASSVDTPSVVTVVDTEAGETALLVNEAQHAAVTAGRAGYSSIDPATVAAYADIRFAMDTAAAALPATADRARLSKVIEFTERYTNALRITNWMNTVNQFKTELAPAAQ